LAYNNNNNNNGGDNNGDSSKRYFFVATGKSRAGAMTSLGPEIGSLIRNNPGVYCQGLYCIDDQGNIIFERKLQYSAIVATEALAAQFGISIVAYDGDNLYTTNCTDSVIALSEVYGEPRVKLLLSNNESSASSSSTTIPMYNLAEYKPGIHKILLLDDDLVKLGHVRTQLEILALLHNATVTQAIPTMLELLPAGCSKAYGVEQVCLALGINPKTELLAIGDAENDVGMLNMASIGVAVGNASPQARNAADCIMKERVDEGGAGLAMNLFGFC
jgi:hydroxymethylpyrimidine pyrophosphatase-like HAD family hydrolase